MSSSACPTFKRGRGTIPKCDTHDTGDQHCNLTCVTGKAWPSGQRPYESYTCGRTTNYTWTPFGIFPDCEEYTTPTDIGFTFVGNFNSDLPNTGQETVKANIETETNQVTCIQRNKCQMTVEWDNNNSESRKRAASGTSITIVFSSSFDGLDDLNIAQYLTDGTVSSDLNELQSTFSDLQHISELLRNKSATIFLVNEDRTAHTLDDSSILSYISVTCPSGHAGTDGLCVQCTEGTYQYQSDCRSCDLGTYQSQKGQTSCIKCPDGYTTPTDLSTDITDCSVEVDQSTADNDDKEEDDDDERDEQPNIPGHPGSIQRGVIVAIALSCIAFVFAVVAVSCVVYKKSVRRKHRTDQHGSRASISQVRPDLDTPYVVEFRQNGHGQAKSNLSELSLSDVDAPPPYDLVPPKKMSW